MPAKGEDLLYTDVRKPNAYESFFLKVMSVIDAPVTYFRGQSILLFKKTHFIYLSNLNISILFDIEITKGINYMLTIYLYIVSMYIIMSILVIYNTLE